MFSALCIKKTGWNCWRLLGRNFRCYYKNVCVF